MLYNQSATSRQVLAAKKSNMKRISDTINSLNVSHSQEELDGEELQKAKNKFSACVIYSIVLFSTRKTKPKARG